MNKRFKHLQKKLLTNKYCFSKLSLKKEVTKHSTNFILIFILSVISILFIYYFPFHHTKNSISAINSNILFPTPVTKDIYKGVIVIDPGHGGIDEGTSADSGALEEKDIVLKIGLYIRKHLKQAGYNVILTREDDKALTETLNEKEDLLIRSSIANISKGDVFVSLHVNFCPDTSVNGITLYHYPDKDNKESISLANSIIKEIKKDDLWLVRDLKGEDFSVLRNTQMPSVLIECGFISNYGDKRMLYNDKYLKDLAYNISEGILNYLNS